MFYNQEYIPRGEWRGERFTFYWEITGTLQRTRSKKGEESFCFLFKQIVRKWETFWTNYIYFLTPPPPPPLLLFLYVKGKWPLQEQTAISFRCGVTPTVTAGLPHQGLSSLGSGGWEHADVLSPESNSASHGPGWCASCPHRPAPNQVPWHHVVHYHLAFVPMGKQHWLAGTKWEPLLFSFPFPLPSSVEAPEHLIEEGGRPPLGRDNPTFPCMKHSN